MLLIVLLLLAIVAMALWTLIDPEGAFRASQGWMLKNRSSIRLSGFAVVVQRVVAVVVLVLALVALVRL